MEHVKLADAKARLSELVDRVEAGETVQITRRGKLVARLVPAALPEKKPFDMAMFEDLDRIIPMQTESAADLVRRMRDSGY